MNLDTPQGPVLYLDGVTVSFDGFKALDSLSLIVEPGELRCIIGPNGAGKTTMMDVITGKTRPDTGEVQFGNAHDLTRMSEPEIARAGIGRKFQKPTVFRNHTVFENLEVALKTDKRVVPTLRARRTPEQDARIDEVLGLIGLRHKADQKADLLPFTMRGAVKTSPPGRFPHLSGLMMPLVFSHFNRGLNSTVMSVPLFVFVRAVLILTTFATAERFSPARAVE